MARSGSQIDFLRRASLTVLGGLLALGVWPAGIQAADMPPLRAVADTAPNFNTLSVDTVNNEILVGNDAQETLQVYSRTANGVVAPLREIAGPNTRITFPGQVVVDPVNNEIWSVGNDIADQATVYERRANGDVAPLRTLSWKAVRLNRAWGLFVDTLNDEVVVPHQKLNQITVWHRLAETGEPPLRTISGALTNLANPHGVFVDAAADEIYVMNLGHSAGSMTAPYITVYNRLDSGNVAPKRTIQGALTGLNNSKAIFVDTVNGEIVTGNGSPSDAVLVFSASANGDVVPLRTLQGALTGLSNPTGVFVDTVNDELLVANWGNHTITVYRRAASGDAAPIRTITPATTQVAVGIGNPGAIYVDTDNDEIGVTNCVSHPRIAVFGRLANGVVAPLRVIEGSRTGLSRSMHGIAVDTVNDEIVAPGNLSSAILVFSRTAAGDAPPLREIIGPLTTLRSPQGVAVDTTNEELLVADETRKSIFVFERTAAGNVAPLRRISGPATGLTSPQHVALDPVHDELIVSDKGSRAEGIPPAIYVFPRLQNGDGAPIRTISGELTLLSEPRQLQYDPVNDEIVLADRHRFQDFTFTDPGLVLVWGRLDNGNVPPRRFIQGPLSTLTSPRSVYVDPLNDEIGAGDTNTHALLIFPRDF